MKRKHKIVLGVALLVLCISIGLGIALWYLFGGNPNDSGDNGDDTTTVTPGDPDENPETPHEHTYTSAVTKEPTCTQAGEMTYTCTCGDSYTEPIAMIAHAEVIDAAVAPSCTQTGLTEGKHCSVCGTVLVEQEVIPMIPHTEVIDAAVKPTCTQTGLTEGKHCSVCDTVLVEQEVVPMTAHTEVIDKAVAPTCTATGLTEGKHCSVCGEILVEQQAIAMIAHSYSDEWTSDDEDHWHVCTECGAKADIAAHIPDRDQPSENDPVKCTICEYIIEPATGHIVHTAGDKWFSDGINHWQTCIGCGIKMNESAHSGGLATCISKAQCTVCNAQYGELAAHAPEIIPAVAPTCTKTGLTEGQKCSVCGTVLVEQEVVPMIAHNYVGKETKKPTCEQEGEMTYTCSVCGSSYSVNIPMTAHTVVIDKAVAPSCTKTGLTEGKHCSVCGTVLVEQEVVPMTAHTEVIDEAVAPTCTQTGLTEGKHCSVCDTVLVKQEVVPMTEHTVVIDAAVKPTCTQTGLTEGKHCSVCGEILVKQEVISANGHSYESNVTKQPTCTEEGVRTYTCSVCDDSYTESIPMTAHTEVVDEAVAPTCTQTGLTEGKHCSVCGEVLVEQEVVPMTEHSYTSEVTKQPTCSQTGERTYTCSACGDSYTASIAALGHQYRVTSRKEATCTQAGEVVYTCTRCGDGYTVKTNASHNYVLVETVAATCTEAGYQLYRCSECEEEFKNIIPAGGGHNYVGTVTLAPTTEREGEMTYTCSVCGDSYTVPLAKLNSGSGYVLLIQDRLPWTTDNNAVILNYLTQSGQIGGWEVVTTQQAAATDLSAYGIIYIANDQTTATYNRLEQLGEELTQFVQGGGVLIYGACDHGWAAGDISYALPGGVSIQNYYSNYNYIVNSAHDIVTGVLTGGEAITDRILYSTYSSHTTFHGLPAGADIILQDAKGDPTLVEYALGNGYVIASGLTWEYTYERTFVDGTSFAKEIYDDLFVYAQTLISGCAHEYLAGETVAPTCSADGYTVYTCTVCGRTYHGDYVEALGHSYTSQVTKQPTCTEEGIRTYTCSACGNSYTESIPMTAHTEVIDEAVAPTCIKTGLTEGKHCSVCGEVLVEQETLPTIDHNYVNGVCTMCGEREPTEGLVFTLSDYGTQYSVTDYTGMATEIYIPAVYEGLPVTSIGDFAFSDCSSLTSITIPDSVTSIGSNAFRNCSSLTNVTLPSSVTSIGYSAFYNCSGLTSITIPDSITSIGERVFSGCSSLTSIEIPDSVTSIGNYAFQYCSNLTSITIPGSVTSIGDFAFSDCSSLTSITIPDSVTSIGYQAFYYCRSLTSITIPDSVTSIGGLAFSGCNGLTSITVASGNPVYRSAGNCLIERVSKTLIAGCKNSIIPSSVKRIDNAFNGCSSLTSIEIPDSVTSIGFGSFEDCSSLASITIPSSVTSIGDEAFRDCSSLASITIPSSVTSIGDEAFYGCDSLTSITIPDSVTSIGSHAFAWCSSLTSITIPDSVTSIGERAFFYCSSLTSITIPDSVTSIGEDAFFGCSSLTSITIGNGVTSIGGGAFRNCSSLTSITIPDSVTSIGYQAFYGCDSLTSIEIPDSVTSIGKWAFVGCDSLTSVTIGNGVTSIGREAFRGCSSLISVTFEDPNGWWVSTSSTATSGTSISSSDLSNPATAAKYLRLTYDDYYWYKR